MIKREATRTVRLIQPITGDFQCRRPHRSERRLASGIRGTERYGIFRRSLRSAAYAPGNPGQPLGLNYSGLISPIVSAIQALSSEITSLENTIAGFAQSFTTQ